MKKIAIIGAGIAGLSLAKMLEKQVEITVFEKSRGVSGRLSTRRIESYAFDHGAQYFTIRTAEFRKFLDPLLDYGVVKEWNPRYIRFNHLVEIKSEFIEDKEVRYVGVPNMSSICKYLSENLNIKLNTKITSLKKDVKWNLYDEDGNCYNNFDWVISTAPSPQTIELFPREFKCYDYVESVNMLGTFALMLGFKDAFECYFDVAHILNSDISWIAFNNTKPDRADNSSMIIHSSEGYFNSNMNNNIEDIILHLSNKASSIVGNDLTVAECRSLHTWRYANVQLGHEIPVLIDASLCLGACGDWCMQGRVEGAFISAYNLSKVIKDLL